MSELTIRRNRDFSSVRPQAAVKAERTSAAGQIDHVGKSTGPAASDSLQQLMTKLGQAESHSRDSRRTLQTGEAVLDEVQDSLERIARLAQKSSGSGTLDRAALQSELEQLREGIDRMLRGALSGDTPLFLEDGLDERADLELNAFLGQFSARQEAIQDLPLWLTQGIVQGAFSAQQLLSALGLDSTSSVEELLAAIQNSSLEQNPAAGYLAALYLGAVIAGSSESASPQEALEGLLRLMDKIAEGVPPDKAVELLTQGEFTSLADFQAQFTSGTAPGLREFLSALLLSDNPSSLLSGSPLLTLMADFGVMNLEVMLALLTALSTQETTEKITPETTAQAGSAADSSTSSASPLQPDSSAPRMSTLSLGGLQATGQDLSGVSFDPATGVFTISGTENLLLRGTGRELPALQITGSGQVTLQDVRAAVLTVSSPEARMLTLGQNTLGRLLLGENTTLTLGGGGLLKLLALEGSPSNTLRLTGGAVIVTDREGKALGELSVPVVIDGPVSLAARAASVSTPSGKALESADLLWKTLLPGWSGITSIAADGRHARMLLTGGAHPDAARLWLYKGDPTHGYPAHSLAFRGRDRKGQLRTRYAYLRWDRRAGRFQPIIMYPNPFTITGGEPGQDWVYEEESHTLRILSAQVTAVSGGTGTDANQIPFSGRIVLADGIGNMRLSLDGVVCRVAAGRAFDLGRQNRVTLVLASGTDNLFESGGGQAGIYLGEGTLLNVDRAMRPAGSLTAAIAAATQPAEEPQWPGIPLQMGGETVLLPQFRLSSEALRLNKLSVATQERAQSANDILEADRRWVARIQKVYSALYYRMERSFNGLHNVSQYISTAGRLVRDTDDAASLMEDMRKSILLQSSQAMRTHSRRGTGDVGRLLR